LARSLEIAACEEIPAQSELEDIQVEAVMAAHTHLAELAPDTDFDLVVYADGLAVHDHVHAQEAAVTGDASAEELVDASAAPLIMALHWGWWSLWVKVEVALLRAPRTWASAEALKSHGLPSKMMWNAVDATSTPVALPANGRGRLALALQTARWEVSSC
jgi:hypothetical protein